MIEMNSDNMGKYLLYIVMVLAAVFLAATGRDGWGWILFVLFLIYQRD
jgi:fatty acid desaturase